MNDKMKRAQTLLGAIGDIDDELVFEAMSYKPRHRSPKLLYIAACIAVIAAIVLCTSVVLQVADRVRMPTVNGLPDGVTITVSEDDGSDTIGETMSPQESLPTEEHPADSYTEIETVGESEKGTMTPQEPQDSEPIIYDSEHETGVFDAETENATSVFDTESENATSVYDTETTDTHPNADGSYGNGGVGSTGGYPDHDGNAVGDGEKEHKTFIIVDIVSSAVLLCALVVLIIVRRRYRDADANDTDN